MILSALAAISVEIPVVASAHPGELDRQGCHTDRRLREYHCHEDRRGLPPPERDIPSDKQAVPDYGIGVHYRSCAEAHASGRYNIRRGEPGYRQGLDGDNDGLACEPFRRRR